MEVNRREFIVLTVSVAITACGRQQSPQPPSNASSAAGENAGDKPQADGEQVLDAGEVKGFIAEGPYDAFREQGAILIRRNGKLWALSSICTHKGCKVRVQADQSFFCKCHKSAFDRDGNVVSGPAPRALPRLSVRIDERKHLLVNLKQPDHP